MFLRDEIKNKDKSSQTKKLLNLLQIEETFSSTRTLQDLESLKTNPNIPQKNILYVWFDWNNINIEKSWESYWFNELSVLFSSISKLKFSN